MKSLYIDFVVRVRLKSNHMKETTHYARQVYLFGEGKQKPIKSVKALSEYTGCPVSTIQDHIQNWREESMSLAIAHDNSPYTLDLSPDVLELHRKQVDFLGKQVTKLKDHLKTLIPADSSYHVVLASYERALSKWEKSSGILAHYATAESAMKERARQHERAKGKANTGDIPAKRKIDKSRFMTD